MTSLFECIYRGFDGLDVSFTSCLPLQSLEALRGARKSAEAISRSTIVTFGPGNFQLDLAETGARGGYKFRGNSGQLGATWFIKDRTTAAPGNIRASVHSESLAVHGFDLVTQLLTQDLGRMGAMETIESVSRIDFAMDFLLPAHFCINPENFVCHSRSHVREHSNPNYSQAEAMISWRGRRTTSVTIGKMPGRQIIVYDKRAEAVSKRKDYWFQIWGISPTDNERVVWRVEIRFGKTYLAERARIYNYKDLQAGMSDLLGDAVQSIRYLERPTNAVNITRASEHLLWLSVRDEIRRSLKPMEKTIDSKQALEQRRKRSLAHRRKLVGSLIPGIVALEGYSIEEGRQLATKIAASCAGELAEGNPDLFLKKAHDATLRAGMRPSGTD